MNNQKKLLVSHAPFWHIGSAVPERHYNTILAALPAVLMGISVFGVPALAVICLAVSSAVGWEFLITRLSKRPITVGDGNAALIGLLFGMLLPATAPWWVVVTGTFVAILIGKQIFGGIGGNPFNPAVLAYRHCDRSAWKTYSGCRCPIAQHGFRFSGRRPIGGLEGLRTRSRRRFDLGDLLIGRQIGGIGAGCGLAMIVGGIYLIARGYIRWEIPVGFHRRRLHYRRAVPHGRSRVVLRARPSIFWPATVSSALSFWPPRTAARRSTTIPMLIYGAMGGIMTMLIRNIGAYPDGIIYAILVINLINPLLDKIRPKALGKVA